jgi:hypothetical protein
MAGEFGPITVKPPLELTFCVPQGDLAPQAPLTKNKPGQFPEWLHHDETIAVRFKEGPGDSAIISQLVVHANYRIKVKAGTRDLSVRHRPLRYLQIWRADLNVSDWSNWKRSSGYTTGATTNAFVVDTMDAEPGLWIDVPGHRVTAQSQQSQPKRWLYEFIVTPQDRPVHGLYFIVIYDLTSTHYRVRISKALTITPAMAADLNPNQSRSAPYRNEAASGPSAIDWKKDYTRRAWPPWYSQLPP